FTYRPTSREWTYRNTMPLAPGVHTVRITSRDRAGNISLLARSLSFVVPPAECGDRVDNDADGLIDFPSDPDCRSVVDDREEREGVVTRAVTAVTTATTVAAKAVAKTTATAARATANTAERASVVVQERVLDNRAVEVATERVIAPTVVVAVVANTATATAATGFQIMTYLQQLLGLLASPGRLFGRRKRKGWGTVYASVSKRPLDLVTVRLVDATTKQVVQTEVTDHLGRFSFVVKRAGTYRIEAQRQGYVFPSATLKGRKEDVAFVDLYYGDAFNVTDAGAVITMNIPLDLRAEGKEEPDAKTIRRHYTRIVSAGVSASGLVLSIVSFAISPRPYVAAILAVNIMLYVLFQRIARGAKRPKSWGTVADAVARSPLHLAIVRLFDTEFNKLLETAVTDRYGRYSFLVGKSVFYVTGQKTGYAQAKSDTIDLTKKEGVVGVDLRLKPAKNEA
ncbi:carboxypeptidase regulatory-like domain-containing protein, partial [Candidatus Uhrbacteria bacterium]|nr:carboxypeptidase regulatory-like domain-containing protein [Candidatus Uhrbacteria bacterium]